MKTTRILLIEDDHDDIEIFEICVRRLNRPVELRTHTNPRTALDELRRDVLPPDLIFIDSFMPRMTGLEVIQELRRIERCALIPAVLYGESDPPDHIAEMHKGSYEEFLKKPSDLDSFCKLLNEAVSRYSSK